jgi:hypothetical protein
MLPSGSILNNVPPQPYFFEFQHREYDWIESPGTGTITMPRGCSRSFDGGVLKRD